MSNARWLTFGVAVCAAAMMGAAAPAPAAAQGFLHKLADKAKEAAKQRAEQREAEAAAAAVGKVEGAIICAVTDLACIRKAKDEGKDVSVTNDQGQPVTSADSAAALAAATNGTTSAASSAGPPGATAASAPATPGTGAWVNYDFVPGDKPIFVDDFGADNVGDFPRRLTFMKGNMEVAEWSGARWLRATSSGSQFAVVLPDTLPDRYTLEFDYAGGDPSAYDYLTVRFSSAPHMQWLEFTPPGNQPPRAGIHDIAMTKLTTSDSAVLHARIMVDGSYAKVYVGSQRVANVPNAKFGKSDSIRFTIALASPEKPVFIGNIRLAAGGRDLYDALARDGHVATHGILFDVGSATIRPESTPTLEKIGEMLKKHAELKLEIEGHTDNTGSAAANQKLSEARAAAVKTYLVSTYEVDDGRLSAKGFGASKPIASNDTPEGRQQNRRVELVKM